MIAIAVSMVIHLAQQERIFDPKFDKHCRTIQSRVGPETNCPDPFDHSRAEHVRRLPPLTLPGHTSDGSTLPLDHGTIYSADCKTALINFYKKTSKLAYWLQRQKNDFRQETLSRNAAYSVEQMIRSYHQQVSKEAKAKDSYKTTDNPVGYVSCATHANYGTKEIYRIGDLVIYELNKGNHNLRRTGLNPYAN